MKQKFTIDDINEMLTEIDFKWLDKQVCNCKTNKYERAAMKHFKGSTAYLLVETDNSEKYLISALIGEDKFVIKFDRAKLDLSKDWIEKLNSKEIAKGV